YQTLPIGQRPNMTVNVAAFDLLNATAQIANGNRQVQLSLGLNLPGIATASLTLGIGERPVGTSWLTV
ncbi:hypothetical protein, partial [Klebsiella pneumoniae]